MARTRRGFEVARTLAGLVAPEDLAAASLYPPLREIRRISLALGTAVATRAWELGLARRRGPANIRRSLAKSMYEP